MNSTFDNATSAFPLTGRILLATLFLMSGLGKLMEPAGTQAYISAAGLPLPMLGYGVAVLVEIGAGALLLVGYRARIAALLLALYSVAAAIGFHAAFGDQNQMIHFLKNFAIAGGLLQIVAFGAGAFSIDNRTEVSAPHRLATR